RTAAPAATAPPKPRVLLIGDSHTLGWGVEDDQTFASVLASEFGYRTVNLGVSSYGTPRELGWLERQGKPLPDDRVVLQYSDNDFDENRQFVETGHIGPYVKADFDRYIGSYRPVPPRTWPVAGVLIQSLWRDVRHQLPFG